MLPEGPSQPDRAPAPDGPPAPPRSLPEPLLMPGTALPLAHGDLDEESAAELRTLKEQIVQAVGFQCASYKEKCLRRRIAVRMRARGVHSYGAYARLLQGDADEYGRLIDVLTINVSKFFRNPDVWAAVRDSVLPELHPAGRTAPLRVWSAGCAGGEEAYSASIVLQDYAAAHGWPAEGYQVIGTDIDPGILELAGRAEYSAFALTDTAPAIRDRWFEGGPPYRLRSEARRGVSFGLLDVLRDPLPRDLDLIFCRNVVIYFERPLQEQLFRRLHSALVPGGFLVLGKVETLSGFATRLFTTVSARARIFRRA